MGSNQIPNDLSKNFGDIACRRKMMELYGDSTFPFSGTNEDGEDVLVSISKTGIVVSTNQSNGWVRVNYYDQDGFPAGETYDGRWKAPDLPGTPAN